MRKKLLADVKRIVVKVGTSSVTENGCISHEKISRLAEDVISLMKRNYQVVVVTSGAISTGAGALKKDRSVLTVPERQAMAAVGQAVLINEYRECFEKLGYSIGQILLTEEDVKNRRRFLNGRHTFEALLDLGIVPVVNENDTIAVKEIKFGDNDTLSAYVAGLIDADLLILLSDVDGFYFDLKNDTGPAELVECITPDIMAKAGDAGSIGGTGGMITKLRAADVMIRFGEKMIIAKSSEPDVLNRIMDGEGLGTLFMGKGKRLPGRKRWVTLGKTRGALVLDSGAVKALSSGNKSLLASGITAVRGSFEMNDVVDMVSENNEAVGKGIVNYNSEELALIIGKSTGEIKKILGGAAFYEEVINRHNMIPAGERS